MDQFSKQSTEISDFEKVADWLAGKVADVVGISKGEIERTQSFADYGVSSIDAVGLVGELEEWLGIELSSTLLFSAPNIDLLAQTVVERLGPRAEAPCARTVAVKHTDAPVSSEESIAIVGMACRLPRAGNIDGLWNVLIEGRDCISELPVDRFGPTPFDSGEPSSGRVPFRWGGFLDREYIEGFDAAFFGISHREAEHLDPQQRLMLELAWEAFEDAGCQPAHLAGKRVGVFAGVSTVDYGIALTRDLRGIDAYSGTGGALSIASNRVSYFFDFHGPSVTIDTACSSSLVALHLACQSLRRRESELALVGGANLIYSRALGINFSKAGVLAADGRCKSFDADADGYARAEGAAVVVLKPLSRALADGDRIYAEIAGSAVWQDGRSNGLMAPRGSAQEAMLRQAYASAGVDPHHVFFVEAHGSGTRLGDPIEASAIAKVLTTGRDSRAPCWIGSIKSNIGHLEAASGMVGLIKAALALHRRTLPPSVHFKRPNSDIPLEAWRLAVPTAPQAIEPGIEGVSIAGVNSLGFGGTIAHVVLRSSAAPPADKRRGRSAEDCPSAQLLPISARSPGSLAANARAWSEFLRSDRSNEVALEALCAAASQRRTHHKYRAAVVGACREELAREFERLGSEREWAGVKPRDARFRNLWLFSGHDGQLANFDYQLYDHCPAFRHAIEEIDPTLIEECGWSAAEWMSVARAPLACDRVDIAHPALFAIQYALSRVWHSWGIEPDAIVGQSVGELAAAVVAGALTPRDGARLICRRSRILQRFSGSGGLLALELGASEAEQLLCAHFARAPEARDVSVAVVSSESSVVLSGARASLDNIAELARAKGVHVTPVAVPFPAHAPQLESCKQEFLAACSGVIGVRPAIPMYSSVEGVVGPIGHVDAEYWWRNARNRVLLGDALRQALGGGFSALLEISPHGVLRKAASSALAAVGNPATLVLASLHRERPALHTLLRSLGALYAVGADPEWRAVTQDRGTPAVSLPNYAWERKRYWFRERFAVGDDFAPGDDATPENAGAHSAHGSSREPCREYELRWVERAHAPEACENLASGTWLVLANAGAEGAVVARQLAARGAACVTVWPGEAYERLDDHNYVVRPDSETDFEALVAALKNMESPLRGIVHLWSLNADVGQEISSLGLERAERNGVRSVLAIQRVLGRAAAPNESKLWLVTRGVHRIRQEDRVSGLAQAPIWGLARTLVLESPNSWGGILDLPELWTSSQSAEAIVALVSANGNCEESMAVRDGCWFVPRLVGLEAVDGACDPELSASGCYLITGAFGGLGQAVARWLVQRGARNLLLIGRRGADSLERRRFVADLEAQGANVCVGAVDVADELALRAFIGDYTASAVAPIRGAIHAAGCVTLSECSETGAAALSETLLPKVQGTLNVARCLPSELEFFVTFSSFVTFMSSPQLGAYAAANAFLDAFAHHERAFGRCAITINWGEWEQVGMAADTQRSLQRKLGSSGTAGFSVEEGLAALGRVLQRKPTQVGVARVSWTTWANSHPMAAAQPILCDLLDRSTTQPVSDERVRVLSREQLQRMPRGEAERAISEFLRALVARTLRVTEASIVSDCALTALGVDSLMAIELRNTLQRELAVTCELRWLIEAHSLADLSGRVLERIRNSSAAGSAEPLHGPDEGTDYPLSWEQRGLWLEQMIRPSLTAYNEAYSWRVRGEPVSVERLEKALAALLERHTILNSVVVLANDGEPRQRAAQQDRAILQVQEANGQTPSELRARMAREANLRIELEQGPIFRVVLYRGAEGGDVLLMIAHHMVLDLWSAGLVVQELEQLYAEAAKDFCDTSTLPPVVPYRRFVAWQTEMLAGSQGARLREYWRTRLKGMNPTLNLPRKSSWSRSPESASVGARCEKKLPSALSQSVRAAARGAGVTSSVFFQACWFALLHRHTGQRDLVVGSPIAGRACAEFAGTIGYFASPACIRVQFDPTMRFTELLEQVRARTLEALEHQGFPPALLRSELDLNRSSKERDLFQAIFAWQRLQLGEAARGRSVAATPEVRFQLEPVAFEQQAAKADLFLAVVEGAQGELEVVLQYRADRFDEAFMAALLEDFTALLAGAAERVHLPICDLPQPGLTMQEERGGVNEPLHARFVREAERNPDAVAVLSGGRQLTYRELHHWSSAFARVLHECGLEREDVVAIVGDRSPELLAAMIGTLKAAGTYLPLNPDLPDERLSYMLKDAGARFVVCAPELLDRVEPLASGVVLFSSGSVPPSAESMSAGPARIEPSTRAYIMYTSGSTGEPNAVEVEHGSGVACLQAFEHETGIQARDVFLSVANFGFDISVLELFLPLSVGASVVLPSSPVVRDANRLLALVAEFRPSFMQATPSYWRLLLAAGFQGDPALKILCGGEAMSLDLAKALSARARTVWNVYGPTETTIWSSAWRVPQAPDRVAIGKPLPGEQIHILDAERRPVPVGVQGEIYISGVGLARGYLNRPELARSRFVELTDGDRVHRAYRTGDLGRMLPDGNIACGGRMDNQVKLRGHRIELDEIAARMTEHPGVAAAVVDLRQDVEREPRLVGYVVPSAELRERLASGRASLHTELQRQLARFLPSAMLPSQYIELDALPLTVSGKVDRRKLPGPRPIEVEPGAESVRISSSTESILMKCWQAVLGVQRVKPADNFFDLGGSSLSAMHLAVEAAKEGLKLEPNTVFEYQTLRELAAAAERVSAQFTAKEAP